MAEAEWQSSSINFDIFEPLRPPIQTVLQVLEVVVTILEAVLDILKPFFLDLLNPLKAVVQTLIAALRAIINQVLGSGFSVLLVHPDFSQPDYSGVLYSASGGYPGFESKVASKFYDTGDLFRPQYPPGSSVGMLVFYFGVDNPGDLLGFLMSLLALIKVPVDFSPLPAPVDVKALPVSESGSSVSQFRSLFDSDLKRAVQLEWRMPQSASGLNAPGFVGQMVSFYNQFRFPNFIIERTGPFPQGEGAEALDPQGDPVHMDASSMNLGKGVVDGLITRYKFPPVNSKIVLREEDKSTYRRFPRKIPIQFGSSGESQSNAQGNPSGVAVDGALTTGIATGTYKFLDEDDDLIPGRTYYYRIRAFFGDAGDYVALTSTSPSDYQAQVVTSGNFKTLRLAPKLQLGRPSRVVKGIVPRAVEGGTSFNPYFAVYRAIIAGLLLNFEVPAAFPPGSGIADTNFRNEQRLGWGTLGMIGGQVGSIKSAFPKSSDFRDSLLTKTAARKLANSVAQKLVESSSLRGVLASQWNAGARQVVDKLVGEVQNALTGEFDGSLEGQVPWTLLGLMGGITRSVGPKTETYLAREESYTGGEAILPGPVPLSGGGKITVITVEERLALANFLRSSLAVVSHQSSYLAWYSVTLGDLFPALIPFLFDFEQFLEALLKAVESALSEIADIVETLIQKVRALMQILQTIDDILKLLEVNVTASILVVGPTTNGSADSLVQGLLTSTNKPGSSPFGLHSGLVMTFGGPGEGFVAALRALGFILGMPT